MGLSRVLGGRSPARRGSVVPVCLGVEVKAGVGDPRVLGAVYGLERLDGIAASPSHPYRAYRLPGAVLSVTGASFQVRRLGVSAGLENVVRSEVEAELWLPRGASTLRSGSTGCWSGGRSRW